VSPQLLNLILWGGLSPSLGKEVYWYGFTLQSKLRNVEPHPA